MHIYCLLEFVSCVQRLRDAAVLTKVEETSHPRGGRAALGGGGRQRARERGRDGSIYVLLLELGPVGPRESRDLALLVRGRYVSYISWYLTLGTQKSHSGFWHWMRP
jgi:hypothetical protein